MKAYLFSGPGARRGLAAALAVALLGVASAAVATTVLLVGIPELGQRATLIVEGRVEATAAVRVDAGPGIFTDSTIVVSDTHKGTHAPTLVVRVPGGQIDGRSAMIEGMPSLKPGTEVLLFLEPLPKGANPDGQTRYLPLGLTQGHMVLRGQGDDATFERVHDLGGAIANHAYCTGGEHERRFSAKTMRRWLADTFGKGEQP